MGHDVNRLANIYVGNCPELRGVRFLVHFLVYPQNRVLRADMFSKARHRAMVPALFAVQVLLESFEQHVFHSFTCA